MKSQEMKEQARLARNKYYREYRARNPDKVREANRRYWQKKAEQEARHVTENADNS